MKTLLAILILLAFSVNATITPEVKLPPNFDSSRFMVKTIRKLTSFFYVQETDDCNNVTFNDYFFISPKTVPPAFYIDEPENIPVSEWFCLFSSGVYIQGYDTGVLPEKVAFNKKMKLWEVVKERKNSGRHKSKKYIPFQIYNVTSKNSKGFLAIDQNITEYDKSEFDDENIKKKFYFCMLRDGFALCGAGNLISNIDGKEIDFTPYLLKSLESMELSVKE